MTKGSSKQLIKGAVYKEKIWFILIAEMNACKAVFPNFFLGRGTLTE